MAGVEKNESSTDATPQKIIQFQPHLVQLANAVLSDFREKVGQRKLIHFTVAVAVDLVAGYFLIHVLRRMTFETKDGLPPIQLHQLLAQKVPPILVEIVGLLRQLLESLMQAPVGLKLNGPLSGFLGRFTLYLLDIWGGFISTSQAQLPRLFQFMTLEVAYCGISVALAVCQDVIKLLTLHLYCFYVYISTLFQFQQHILSMLYNLFRGKKSNPLRGRVDTSDFDTDQLLLGTVFFTISVFLHPTVLAFYVVFYVIRIVQQSLIGSIGLLLGVWRCVLAGCANVLVGFVYPFAAESVVCYHVHDDDDDDTDLQGHLPHPRLCHRRMSTVSRFFHGWSNKTIMATLPHRDA
eukprot:m.122125 g.122125  ORF g.122125 m.122125 type:complete len:350 (-) comp28901_c0_seq6:167-1216(-)